MSFLCSIRLVVALLFEVVVVSAKETKQTLQRTMKASLASMAFRIRTLLTVQFLYSNFQFLYLNSRFELPLHVAWLVLLWLLFSAVRPFRSPRWALQPKCRLNRLHRFVLESTTRKSSPKSKSTGTVWKKRLRKCGDGSTLLLSSDYPFVPCPLPTLFSLTYTLIALMVNCPSICMFAPRSSLGNAMTVISLISSAGKNAVPKNKLEFWYTRVAWLIPVVP